MDNSVIEQAIQRSQHCQRNWDLTKQIPQSDIDLIVTAATQCPSKQNLAHYTIHAITDRNIIEKIHAMTDGFKINFATGATTTNTQTLANLLLAFEGYRVIPNNMINNDFIKSMVNKETLSPAQEAEIIRDKWMSMGIASGYANLIANILGYSSGYCACLQQSEIKKILNAENDINLILGVGYPDPALGRTVHHVNHNFSYPSFKKQKIKIVYHN
jgi:nitroreductase